jgi:macrolide transport system ATP-binding/permease protein
MIDLKNITKIYRTGKLEFKALDDISLSIKNGEFIAIMGPSGSGKSTLMNILGFLDKPDGGTYSILGNDISSLDDDQLSILRNRVAGFIFQQYQLLPRMTALRNTELPLIYAGIKDRITPAKAKITDVGLAHRETHYPNELSGGEQQRVAIARSIVNEPMIIFADEPTGNLDTKSEEEILKILTKLNEGGKTIIMVTHENEVAAYAKRVIRMRDGKIISDETKTDKNKSRKKNENKTEIKNENASKNAKDINDIFNKSHSSFGRAEFKDFFRQAIIAIISHKLRSFLSILGILIGVSAVISMLALGAGAQASITESMSSLGTNVISIMPNYSRRQGVSMGMGGGSQVRFDEGDVKELSKLEIVKNVSPIVGGFGSQGQLVYLDKNWRTNIQGIGTAYESMHTLKPIAGRFFTEEEVKQRLQVVLLGTTVVKELFGENNNPVGQEIKINRKNFIVIGVLPTRGGSGGFMGDPDDTAIVPYTTAMYRLLGQKNIGSIEVEIKSTELLTGAEDKIKSTLSNLKKLKDSDSIRTFNSTQIREMVSTTIKTLTLLLGSVAAISLFVGGIGIMNIMLVSVKERTKEIGLRKAIGARRMDILIQFLIEAILMTFAGGLLGILLSVTISQVISIVVHWDMKISMVSVLLSTGFAVAVGIIFGFYPAVQASRLRPIEALRYE